MLDGPFRVENKTLTYLLGSICELRLFIWKIFKCGHTFLSLKSVSELIYAYLLGSFSKPSVEHPYHFLEGVPPRGNKAIDLLGFLIPCFSAICHQCIPVLYDWPCGSTNLWGAPWLSYRATGSPSYLWSDFSFPVLLLRECLVSRPLLNTRTNPDLMPHYINTLVKYSLYPHPLGHHCLTKVIPSPTLPPPCPGLGGGGGLLWLVHKCIS